MYFHHLEHGKYYRCSNLKGNSAILKAGEAIGGGICISLYMDMDYGTIRAMDDLEMSRVRQLGIFSEVSSEELAKYKREAKKRIDDF